MNRKFVLYVLPFFMLFISCYNTVLPKTTASRSLLFSPREFSHLLFSGDILIGEDSRGDLELYFIWHEGDSLEFWHHIDGAFEKRTIYDLYSGKDVSQIRWGVLPLMRPTPLVDEDFSELRAFLKNSSEADFIDLYSKMDVVKRVSGRTRENFLAGGRHPSLKGGYRFGEYLHFVLFSSSEYEEILIRLFVDM